MDRFSGDRSAYLRHCALAPDCLSMYSCLYLYQGILVLENLLLIMDNDAIQRFSPAIQTKRLERAKFTPVLYEEIEKGMSDCSDWVHDQARAINNPPPKVVKLEAFLTTFNEFVKKCR